MMKTSITTRHFELSDSLKDRTEERLKKLHRYFDRILDARVVVSFEKNRYNAEAVLTANGTPLSSHAVGESDRAALEQVLDKLEVQVRKHKDRLIRSRRGPAAGALAGQAPSGDSAPEDIQAAAPGFDEGDLEDLVSEDGGERGVIMSLAEAAAQLRVSSRETLDFVNALNQRRTLLFKRRDGKVGIVDIHGASS